MKKIEAVVLAAGKSTRMKSALPKVLHPVCGSPLATYPANALLAAGIKKVVIVIRPEHKTRFNSLFEGYKGVSLTIQGRREGTAAAVRSALPFLSKTSEYTVIIPGDVPLIREETISALINETCLHNAVCGLITAEMENPAGYGRIVRDGRGNIKAVVEAKDADPKTLSIREINSSIYCVKRQWLFEIIGRISSKNAQNEFYLTDIIKTASEEGLAVFALRLPEASEIMGVNTRKELAEADRLMRYRILDRLMSEGVGITDELHTYIDDGVKIGADTTILPHSFISGKTKIGKNCLIENGVVIKNSVIGDNSAVRSYSVIEESSVGKGAQVGPFARLRPGTVIEGKAKIGNFVEVKKSIVRKGAKANHLSYIGDAVIGRRTNVGCGTITCNYDGRAKHKTIVGDDVFIGSDVQFVAPVRIGGGAVIGAGSTITEDVPKNSLAIARTRQVIKKSWRKK